MVTDNFNRANETPLAGPWVHTQNSTKLVSNKAQISNDAVYNFSYYDVPCNSDHGSYIDIDSNGGAVDAELTVRHQSNGDLYMEMVHTSVHRFYKYVGSSFTQLIDSGLTPSFPAQYGTTVTGTGGSQVLEAWKNGVSQFTVSDATLSGGKFGWGGAIGTVLYDNWQGTGEAAIAPTVSLAWLPRHTSLQGIKGAVQARTGFIPASNPAGYPIFSFGLLTDLVSHWQGNESSGNVADFFGSNPLTDISGLLGAATIEGTPARDFKFANQDCATHVDNADLSFAGKSFTFAVRCQFGSGPNVAYLIRKDQAADASLDLALRYSLSIDKFVFDLLCVGPTILSVTSTVVGATSTSIHYVFFGYDALANEYWIREGNQARQSVSLGADVIADSASTTFRIGARSGVNGTGTGETWDGPIFPVTLWNGNKTDNQLSRWKAIKGDINQFT